MLFRSIFKMYLRKAGIKHDYVVHSLRHTVAKRLLDRIQISTGTLKMRVSVM